MKRIKGQLYDLSENIDDYLFYDHEEFRNHALYAAGKDDGKEEGFKEGHKSGFEDGHKSGFEEGQKEGEKLKAIEIAKLMKQKDMNYTAIHELTGLTIQEIDNLNNN